MFPTFHTYFYAEFFTHMNVHPGYRRRFFFFGLKNQKTYFLFSISFCRFISFSSPFSPSHHTTTPWRKIMEKVSIFQMLFCGRKFFSPEKPKPPLQAQSVSHKPGLQKWIWCVGSDCERACVCEKYMQSIRFTRVQHTHPHPHLETVELFEGR